MTITQYVVADNVSTTLATAASSTATTFTLASAANLPTLSAGQAMPLTMNDAATGLIYEVVYVTAISGVTLTVVRAQEGTGAQNWNIGDYAFCAPTSGTVATSLGNPSNTFLVAPATASQHAVPMAQAAGVVGATRNLGMNVGAGTGTPNASGTVTADEIIVETALGGVRYCLPSFSKTVNLGTTGAGGMDTGSAPASGFVGIYAIYNPTTGASALLATNATSAVVPNVYGGANMPAGYTASALVSVWPTTAGSILAIGIQNDRSVYTANIQVLSTSTQVGSLTALSIASAVPKNAKCVSGTAVVSSTAAAANITNLAGSAAGIGLVVISSGSQAAAGTEGAYSKLPIATAQTIYYAATASAGTMSFTLNCTGYDF